MTRGNQRDIDRKRAEARAAKRGGKGTPSDGLSAAQRKERDAAIMREKQKAKEQAKEQAKK